MDVQGIRAAYGYAIKHRDQVQQQDPIQKPEVSEHTAVGQETDQPEKDSDMVLSKPEQNFFEQLYPESQNEIRSYPVYRKDGARISMNTGTIVDRRG